MSTVFLLLTVLLVLCVYKLLTRKHDVFKRRGVVYQKPIVFFGNMFDAFVWGESLDSAIGILYERFSREKLFGIFILHRPIFVVKDVELIRKIGSSNNFSSGFGNEFDELDVRQTIDPNHPYSHENQIMKNNLNSIFNCSSAGNMRKEKLSKTAKIVCDYVQKRQKGYLLEFETKDVFDRFLAESVASIIFNESNAEKIDEIRQVVRYINEDLTSFKGSVKIMLNSFIPAVFKMKVFRKEVLDFFHKTTLRIREKTDNNNENDVIEDHQLFKHILSLFTGGFQATQKLLQSCFVELCIHQDVQTELIKEVDKAKSFSDQPLNSMEYLDKVVKEILRKSSPIKSFTRTCNKTCSIASNEGEVWKFMENDVIHIPTALIQNDNKIIRNPEVFNPSRLDNDRLMLTFGLGSNQCLGSNFVILQAKALIYTFLTQYSIIGFEKIDGENCLIKLKCR